MIKLLVSIDAWVRKILTAFCACLLAAMVVFTIYTVVMRYVFNNPPVWGDLLTVLSNIWLVFIALALTVREKQHIALNLIYSYLPKVFGFVIQQFWTIVIFSLGYVIFISGSDVVAKMGGKYWEMWHFAWENGKFVFKENYMPKSYAVTILPISGILVMLSALTAIIEDIVNYKNGTFKVSSGSGEDAQ